MISLKCTTGALKDQLLIDQLTLNDTGVTVTRLV